MIIYIREWNVSILILNNSLCFFLVTSDAPTWSELKLISLPNLVTKQEEKQWKKDYPDDIVPNTPLFEKTELLRQWGKKFLEEIKNDYLERYRGFMVSFNMEQAQERGKQFEPINVEIMKSSALLAPEVLPPRVKEIKAEDSDLAKFTKEIDYKVVIGKHFISKLENALSTTNSSKQLLGIINIIKSTKAAMSQ